jgi:hypothetical protein
VVEPRFTEDQKHNGQTERPTHATRQWSAAFPRRRGAFQRRLACQNHAREHNGTQAASLQSVLQDGYYSSADATSP